MMSEKTMLIAFGGFAGTGKTTISSRLSTELGIPRLSSDALRRVVQSSEGFPEDRVNAGWIAYDVLFNLCEEFLERGISTIVDTNLGWEFHWQWLDSIRERYRQVAVLPILLRCPLETCLERIRERHERDPIQHAPPELYMTDQKIVDIGKYLARLDRPDMHRIDAARSLDDVYDDVKRYVNLRLLSERDEGHSRISL